MGNGQLAVLDVRREHKDSQRSDRRRRQAKEERRRAAAEIDARHELYDEERKHELIDSKHAEILIKIPQKRPGGSDLSDLILLYFYDKIIL